MSLTVLHDYARDLLGKLATSGWRPFWGFGGGYLSLKLVWFAAIDVPERGLSVPDGFYVFILGFVSLYVSTFIVRGVEKHLERRGGAPVVAREPAPGGGMVNNDALQATA